VAITVVLYAITVHGITVGYHRLFTHKAFKPNRAVKVALAVAGSMAVQGPVIRWVADHRKHHKFSDRYGDPHSPWRYGTSLAALARGFFHAHTGWLFDAEQTPQRQYAPDLMKDRDLVRVTGTSRCGSL
jgi:stearoyl-CoA desaturase (delta-9 desaturase)